MSASTPPPHEPSSGSISWEATRTETGEVLARGQRPLRPADFEVMITPAHPTPSLNRLRLGPRQVAGDLASWLVTRGRARSTKRLRLSNGFWLVLAEHPGPTLPLGMALQAVREGEHTFSWDWFDSDDHATTATKLQETGALTLELALAPDHNHEIVTTTFVTDVSLRLQADDEPDHHKPRYRVRILAGSTVRWPPAADGIKLLPRLRPQHPHSP